MAVTINKTRLERDILPHVFKPARYLGLEQGAFRKPFETASVTMAVAFPELYEIGFSHYGLKLLYTLVNRQPDFMCDRVYAPAPDFKEQLARHGMPLYAVESMAPLPQFDLLAFSLQYELNYTTLLGMLDAAQIPFHSADRTSPPPSSPCGPLGYPILIAGGPGSANPMPLAPFFDAFIIGDGEEVLLEILRVIEQGKKARAGREAILDRMARLEGLYMPGRTERAGKRIVNIAENPVELAPLIPLVGAVHDRVTVEARRGCDRMCRFCQPCFINLPVREQSIETIRKSALSEIEKTGYEECSLLSLSIADYSYFKPLILDVAGALAKENVSLSLPSQRADRFSLDVAEAVQSIRKSTLTFAPEAGTPRLRNVINKNLSDEEIMNAVTTAYQAGWNKVKLYFIIGLPTETEADLDGIVDIVRRMQAACAEISREKGRSLKDRLAVNVTLSNFVPKPHTPFQWFPQDTMAMLKGKINYLRDRFRGLGGVKINFTDPEISKLEALVSRGGPELAPVIEAAYRNGAYLDAWDDRRNFDKWFTALEAAGIDCEGYTRDRCCDPEEPLPWDAIDVGLSREWLKTEYHRAVEAAATTPCFETCSTCGVCAEYGTWPVFTETPAAQKEKPASKKTSAKTPPANGKNGSPAVSGLQGMAVCKARVSLEKQGDLRFISHLDWLRMIYRAIARAGLPVAYSQGFNPKPRLSFSPALPLFTESACEMVDIELLAPVENVHDRLNPYLPPGGKAFRAELVAPDARSIERSIRRIAYRATYTGDTTCIDSGLRVMMEERLRVLTSQTALPVEVDAKPKNKPKKGLQPGLQANARKVLNLAPYLVNLEIDPDGAVCFTLLQNAGSQSPSEETGSEPAVPGEDVLQNRQVPTNPSSPSGSGSEGNPVIDGIARQQMLDQAFDANHSGQQPPRQAVQNTETPPATVYSIKPAWVLDLINPNLDWSLVRTALVLEPPPPYSGTSLAKTRANTPIASRDHNIPASSLSG